VRALEETEYVAIAKLAMHNREYTVILRPHEHGLVLHTMYYQDEVREMPDIGTDHMNLRESELKVAHQLIEALAAKWDPTKFHDSFEDNLKKLIKAHLEGKEITPVEKPRKLSTPVDLMAALKQSLAQMEGKKKGAQRAEAAEEEKSSARSRKKPVKRAA